MTSGRCHHPPCHLRSLGDTSGRGAGAPERPQAPSAHQEQANAALGTPESAAPGRPAPATGMGQPPKKRGGSRARATPLPWPAPGPRVREAGGGGRGGDEHHGCCCWRVGSVLEAAAAPPGLGAGQAAHLTVVRARLVHEGAVLAGPHGRRDGVRRAAHGTVLVQSGELDADCAAELLDGGPLL